MTKLHVVVYKSFADMQNALTSQVDEHRSRLFIMCDLGDYQQPKEFKYKDGVRVLQFEDSVTVFVKHDLPAKHIGMLEYYIYRHTNMRGDNIKISSLEVFETPNTQLKKYLVRKL